MAAAGAWRTFLAECRIYAYILFSPRCLLPKAAVLAGFSYMLGPWDLIPNATPFFGHFDEAGFSLAGLLLARLMFQAGQNGPATALRRAPPPSSGALPPAWLRATRSHLLSLWLVATRSIRRSHHHTRRAVLRLSNQTSAALGERDAASALFRLLGYRLWWNLRSPFAPTRSKLANLVVIGGSPRSGTTLLRAILGRHPGIFAAPESTVFLQRISSPTDIAERLGWDATQIESWQRASRSQTEFVEHFAAEAARRSGKPVWAEKTPSNVLRFGFVRRRFPRAKLVHVIRDGRDVVCSLRRQPFSKVDDASWNSAAAARRCALQWRTHVIAGLRFRGDPAYHEVRYEDLVRDPEPALRALLAFLGLPWSDTLLTPAPDPGPPDPFEPRAAGAIFDSSVGGWREKLSHEDRAAVRLLTGPLLEKLGYDQVQ